MGYEVDRDNHKHLWARWKFSHASKCDYVTNNIAETFNSWIRNENSLPVIPLMDRTPWPKVQMTFKLWPPRFKRATGRPRNRRIKSSVEGCKTCRQMRYKRCSQFGHMMNTYIETVYDSNSPPLVAQKPKK
jgi:hypothetical protein